MRKVSEANHKEKRGKMYLKENLRKEVARFTHLCSLIPIVTSRGRVGAAPVVTPEEAVTPPAEIVGQDQTGRKEAIAKEANDQVTQIVQGIESKENHPVGRTSHLASKAQEEKASLLTSLSARMQAIQLKLMRSRLKCPKEVQNRCQPRRASRSWTFTKKLSK